MTADEGIIIQKDLQLDDCRLKKKLSNSWLAIRDGELKKHDFTHHMVYIEKKHLRMILKDEMINRTELYHGSKKYNAMMDKKKLEVLLKVIQKKKLEVLLKVIQRTVNKNPEKQKVIDMSVIEICFEESVSPEQAFFLLLFLCCFFIIMAIFLS